MSSREGGKRKRGEEKQAETEKKKRKLEDKVRVEECLSLMKVCVLWRCWCLLTSRHSLVFFSSSVTKF